MRLLVRSADGSLRRPEPTGCSPDFCGDNDGALVLVVDDEPRDVGLHLMAGDDTDPPTHYAYDVELYTLNERNRSGVGKVGSSRSLVSS